MRESKNVLSLSGSPCRDTPPGVSPYFPVRSADTPGGVSLQGYLWLPWRGSAHRFPRGKDFEAFGFFVVFIKN